MCFEQKSFVLSAQRSEKDEEYCIFVPLTKSNPLRENLRRGEVALKDPKWALHKILWHTTVDIGRIGRSNPWLDTH